jgi:hypothetical protein
MVSSASSFRAKLLTHSDKTAWTLVKKAGTLNVSKNI